MLGSKTDIPASRRSKFRGRSKFKSLGREDRQKIAERGSAPSRTNFHAGKDPFASRRPLLSDLPAQAFRDLLPGQTPIAWLDDTRMLVFTGYNPNDNQQKRLAVITP